MTYSIIATLVHSDMQKEVMKKVITVVAPLDLNNGNPAIKVSSVKVFFLQAIDLLCISFLVPTNKIFTW